MKSSMRTMFVVLVIVMSFVAVQAVWAGTIDPNDTITVEGTVVSFHDPIGIVVETDFGEVTVGGIGPVWFWENQSAIPEIDDAVKIEAYETDTTLIACSIEIDGTTIDLRNDDGSPVWNKKPPAETTASSATAGDGTCPGCPGCDGACDSECDGTRDRLRLKDGSCQ